MRLAAPIVGFLVLGAGWVWSNGSAQPPDPFEVAQALIHPRVALRIVYPAEHPAKLLLPDGQSRAILSLLNMRRPLHFGEFLWDETGVPAGAVWVRVDLARQTLSVFRAGHEIGSTLILYGMNRKPTPSGVFPVLAKTKAHRSTLYDAEMPFMLRLTGDGVAIHASNVRAASATHGCIGVPSDFARLLYDEVHIGDPVAIIGV